MNELARRIMKSAPLGFRPLILFCVITLVFIGPKIWPLRIDNTLETLLEQGAAQATIDKDIQSTFGALDEISILAYHDENLFTNHNLRMIKEITKRIEAVKGIKNCFSLANTPFFRSSQSDGETIIESAPLLDTIPNDEAALDRLKSDATGNELFVSNIVSSDGCTAAFNIIMENGLDPFEKESLIRKIRNLTNEYAGMAAGEFHLTGMHVFMETTGVQMQRDVMQFSSVSIIVLFIAIYLVFKSVAAALCGLLTAGIAVWMLMVNLHFLGKNLSISTTPVPAITMGLAIAYVLHLIVAKKEGKLEAAEETSQIFAGTVLSALTTMIGFLSLCLNPIPTLKDFGLFAGLGTFHAAAATMLFGYPLLLRLKMQPRKDFGSAVKHYLEIIPFKYKRTIIFISVLTFLSGLFIFRMEVETDYYRYYLRSAPMIKAVDSVNRSIGGQYPIVVEFTSQNANDVHKSKHLDLLVNFSKHMQKFHGVDKIITYLDLLNDGYSAFSDNPVQGWYSNDAMVAQIAMIVNDAGPEITSYYVDPQARKSLVFIRTSHINSAAFLRIDEGIKAFMAAHLPEGITYRVGGTYLRTVNSANRMALSQLSGTFIAFFVLFLTAFAAIPRIKLIFIAVIANLLPILGVYGVLGLLGETLNMGTTTIASISIGIGMDDTMHFITRFINGMSETGNPHKSARSVIHSSGVSMILTSVMISLAFLSLSLSIIKPIYQLGIFTSLTMVLCLLADLFLMPILVTSFIRPKDCACMEFGSNAAND